MTIEGLGERIRAARNGRGWTQIDLAKAVALNPDTIARYERGDREPITSDLEFIARALDVSVAYLVGEDVGLSAWELLLHESPATRALIRTLAGIPEEERAELLRIAQDPRLRTRLVDLVQLLAQI